MFGAKHSRPRPLVASQPWHSTAASNFVGNLGRRRITAPRCVHAAYLRVVRDDLTQEEGGQRKEENREYFRPVRTRVVVTWTSPDNAKTEGKPQLEHGTSAKQNPYTSGGDAVEP